MTPPDLFEDLLVFSRALIATKDVDPVYDVLREVIRAEGLSRSQAHWLVWLYLGYYNTPAAFATFLAFPDPREGTFGELTRWESDHRHVLHCNIERRGLRGGKVVEFLGRSVALMGGEPDAWLALDLSDDPEKNFWHLWGRLQTVPYVGRWAAFKALDLLLHVLDYPITFVDMRLADCSGPRQALERLYLGQIDTRQDPAYIAWLDGRGRDLLEWFAARGLPVAYDVLETCLCNFHSTMQKHYYVGHDLDEMAGDIAAGPEEARDRLWRARQAVFDERLLGELHGWMGVRKHLLGVYALKREIVNREWGER